MYHANGNQYAGANLDPVLGYGDSYCHAACPTMDDVSSTVQAPTPTLAPDAWKSMPIVPVVSTRMIAVYQAGLAAGRDPNRFSKIGDCQNITTYFLASFDNPKDYRLGTQYALPPADD